MELPTKLKVSNFSVARNRVRKGEVLFIKGNEVSTLQKRNWLGHLALICLILVGTVFGWSALPKVQGEGLGNQPQRSIIISGIGELEVEPDLAIIHIGVETHQQTAQQAQEENSRIMHNILTELEQFGLEQKDIRTSRFDVQPQRQYDRRPEFPEIIGYQVVNEIAVTIRNLEDIGSILDTAVQAGANNINRVTFTLEDMENWQLQALDLAVQQAHEKAQAIAEALDVEIKGVLMVSDSSTLPRNSSPMIKMAAFEMNTPIQVGTVNISTQVEIQFEI